MKKADYAEIASTYAQARRVTPANLRLWLDPIRAFCDGRDDPAVADLGCGTGNFAVPFSYDCGFVTTGIDASPQMLAVAREKDPQQRIRWVEADVEAWQAADPFDIVFMSHLLHHLRAPGDFLGKCLAWVRPGGAVWVRFGAMEHIRDDVVHRFFPSAVAIDAERTPSTDQVESWLQAAGFQGVTTRAIAQRSFSSPAERLRSIRLKGTSVLTLLTDAEFGEGLAALEQYIVEHPANAWLLDDTISLTCGLRK